MDEKDTWVAQQRLVWDIRMAWVPTIPIGEWFDIAEAIARFRGRSCDGCGWSPGDAPTDADGLRVTGGAVHELSGAWRCADCVTGDIHDALDEYHARRRAPMGIY